MPKKIKAINKSVYNLHMGIMEQYARDIALIKQQDNQNSINNKTIKSKKNTNKKRKKKGSSILSNSSNNKQRRPKFATSKMGENRRRLSKKNIKEK
jgi:hypothetical protein